MRPLPYRSGPNSACSAAGSASATAWPGFRPEVSVGYRTATVDSVSVTKSDLPAALLGPLNTALADVTGTVSSIDLAANLYYDIRAAAPHSPSTLASAAECRW